MAVEDRFRAVVLLAAGLGANENRTIAEANPVNFAPYIRCPKLMIHGDQDEIIPLELGRQVFDAAKPPKSFHLITGARHNDTYHVGGASYFQVFADFAGRAVRS